MSSSAPRFPALAELIQSWWVEPGLWTVFSSVDAITVRKADTDLAMAAASFGNCTNQYEWSVVCPKTIAHDFIARMNRDYLGALFRSKFKPVANAGGGAG